MKSTSIIINSLPDTMLKSIILYLDIKSLYSLLETSREINARGKICQTILKKQLEEIHAMIVELNFKCGKNNFSVDIKMPSWATLAETKLAGIEPALEHFARVEKDYNERQIDRAKIKEIKKATTVYNDKAKPLSIKIFSYPSTVDEQTRLIQCQALQKKQTLVLLKINLPCVLLIVIKIPQLPHASLCR